MTDLATLVVKLEAETSKYQKSLEDSTNQLKKFQKDVTDSVSDIAKQVVELLAAKELVDFVQNVIEADAQLGKLAQQTGIAVEQLSALQAAAKVEGVDELGLSLVKLSRAQEEAATGNKKLQGYFAALGITMNDLQKSSPQELLAKVSDAFSKTQDGAAKATVQIALFGRGAGPALTAFLNQGSDAIQSLEDKMASLGVTIDKDTSEKAEAFEVTLRELQAAGQGLVQVVLAKALPLLQAIADTFLDDAKGGVEFAKSADGIVTGLKLITDIGYTVYKTFGDIGTALGALGALAAAAAKGQFKEAATIWKDYNADAQKSEKESNAFFDKLWSDRKGTLEEVTVTVQKMKDKINLPVDDKVMDNAIKKLTEFKDGLDQQIATFGLGQAAATKYSVEFGKLSLEVAAAGTQGLKLKAAIEADADALEKLKNANALQQIDAQIQALTGHTLAAADATVALQNKTLRSSLTAAGDAAGLKQLDTLESLQHAQAQFNELQVEGSKIQSDLADKIATIQQQQEAGALTELDAQQKIQDARKIAVAQLSDIADAEKDVANASGIPTLQENAKKSQAAIGALTAQTNQLADKLRTDVTNSASDAFTEFVTGAKSAGDAFADLLNDIEKQLVQLASKQLFQSLFSTGASGGGGGGIFGTLAGLFASGATAHSGGGRYSAGDLIQVGEHGTETMIPDHDGTIMPHGWNGSGVQLTNHFYIQAPTGSVSRATQVQIGAATARAINAANLRNN